MFRTFSISTRPPWNMHRTRPRRSTGTASVGCGQIYAAIWTRRWYQRNISRYAFTFLLVLFLINSAHCHDALGARDNPGNQAIALHRDGIKAWKPISDECVHMFNSNSNQPSGGLDTSVWNRLHFETDQLRSIAAVCVTIEKSIKRILVKNKTLYYSFVNHYEIISSKVSSNNLVRNVMKIVRVCLLHFLLVLPKQPRGPLHCAKFLWD